MDNKVSEYIKNNAKSLGINDLSTVKISKIGQGDYNINYRIQDGNRNLLLRLNIESQSGLVNQIAYEYKTLRFLKPYGIAPTPIYLDDSKNYFTYGLLVEEFIPGNELVFSIDSIKRTAKTIAKLHSIPIKGQDFMRWNNPLKEQYDQAKDDLEKYKKRKVKNKELISLGSNFLSKLEKNLSNFEKEYVPRSLTHTDLNAANIIDNGQEAYLLDWEKARIDDPSYDVAIFFSKLLNLWASPRVLTTDEKRAFLDVYIQETNDETIEKRIKNRLILYTLHGVFWAAQRLSDVEEGVIDKNLGEQNYERYKKFADLEELKILL